MAKGKYSEAAIQFTNAVHIDSRYSEARYQLAICDLKIGAFQNGYAELVRATELDPDNLKAQIDLGNLALAAGQVQKATDRADFVLGKDPQNVDAHILKANAAAGSKQMDLALTEIEDAIQLSPERSDVYMNRGVFETVAGGDDVKAEESFKKAVQLAPDSVPAHLMLGNFYDHAQRFDDADQQLQRALAIAPKDLRVRNALIVHYLLQGKRNQAEQAAKEAKQALGDTPAGARFLGDYYIRVHDLPSATGEYATLAKQYPKDIDVQRRYLSILGARGLDTEAIVQADKILDRDSKETSALLAKSAILLRQGKASEARLLLERAVKSDPGNVAAHFELGLAYKETGDLGQAEGEFRSATQIRPDFRPAQQALADLAVAKGDYRLLEDAAKELIERFPTAADGFIMRATVAMNRRDFGAAETDLQQAAKLDPNSPMPYLKLGLLRAGLRKDQEAESLFLEALKRSPENLEALRGLASLDIKRNQPAKAVELLQAQVNRFPDNPELRFLLAQLFSYQHRNQDAETQLTNLLKLRPENKSAYLFLASLQLSDKRPNDAVATLNSLKQRSPVDAEPYWLLGSIYDQQSNSSEAEKMYRKALSLRPDMGVAANNLAYLLLQRGGNLDEVISLAQIARKQLPNSPAAADTLGWAYCQKGIGGLALQMLQDAVKEGPQSPTYHYHLGIAYQRSGDNNQARSELYKALQLEKSGASLQLIRKSLAELSHG